MNESVTDRNGLVLTTCAFCAIKTHRVNPLGPQSTRVKTVRVELFPFQQLMVFILFSHCFSLAPTRVRFWQSSCSRYVRIERNLAMSRKLTIKYIMTINYYNVLDERFEIIINTHESWAFSRANDRKQPWKNIWTSVLFDLDGCRISFESNNPKRQKGLPRVGLDVFWLNDASPVWWWATTVKKQYRIARLSNHFKTKAAATAAIFRVL